MNHFQYHFVYQTTNTINNKIYIGIHSTNDINDGYQGSGLHLKRAFKKYGKANFKTEIIYHGTSRDDISKKEQELVTEEFCQLTTTYNMRTGGDNNFIHSIQTCNLMKDAWTDDRRKEQSARTVQHNKSSYMRKKGSILRTGRKLTQEWKDNSSKAKLGRPGTSFTQERKDLMSEKRSGDGNPMFGKSQSEDTKQKMRLKKLESRKARWGELYDILYHLWVAAEKCSAYKFSSWLEQNTEYKFSSGRLSALIKDYSLVSTTLLY